MNPIHFGGVTFGGVAWITTAKLATAAKKVQAIDAKHSVGLATWFGNDKHGAQGRVVYGQDAVDMLQKIGIDVSLEEPKEVNDTKIATGLQEKFGDEGLTRMGSMVSAYSAFLREAGAEIEYISTRKPKQDDGPSCG